MWIYVAAVLLCVRPGGCSEKANTSNLIEHTAADFYEKLHSGKIMFIYFEQQVSPTISQFLVELEKSAEVLQDYSVLVGKVNCYKELVHTYCSDKMILHTAFLFRGGKEFLSFDLDTVFDVNSIVSEVLFAILRDEVKYVHTDTDLLAMEKAARGKKDMVLGYVRSLGTQEHRSMMETAYVYGSKYQFILITGGPVLKHLGVNESSHSSRLWFLHCRGHGGFMTSDPRCPLTLMRRHLSTLSLHSFLQLMEAPLVSEVYEDPSSIQPPQFPYHLTPQVFLFSHPATKHLDLDTATTLAWRLRGIALLLLVHRENPAVKTPEIYNAAYRLPEKSSEVKYLTLHSLDEVLDLFTHQEKDEEEEEEEDEEDEEEDSHFGKLDDEIAASVFENRGKILDMDSVTQLTSENFHVAIAENSLTVALFYLKWDAVSMDFLNSFIEIAEKLADYEVDDVQMSVVDCGEWTDLCTSQPITAFPTVLFFRPQEEAQYYRGMLGNEALHHFIMMSRTDSPMLLNTQEEVESFLQEVNDKVVGVFKTNTGLQVFIEAAKSLRGEILTGQVTDELAEKWASDLGLNLPSVLVFPSWRTHTHPSILHLPSTAEELLTHIKAARLHPMPELTVGNLPSFLSLGKTLLLLFVGEEEDDIGRKQNQVLVEEMKVLLQEGGRRMDPYLVCWIHLGRTPVAMSVLGSYLGSMPPLPALVLTHLPSRSEIYQYPPNSPFVASSILQWVKKVEVGGETPAGMLGEDRWTPAVEFYDFLKVMDMQDSTLQEEEEEEEEEEEIEEEEEEDVEEHHNPENNFNAHTEL